MGRGGGMGGGSGTGCGSGTGGGPGGFGTPTCFNPLSSDKRKKDAGAHRSRCVDRVKKHESPLLPSIEPWRANAGHLGR